MTPPRRWAPSEDHESRLFAAWLEHLLKAGRILEYTHIPNETPTSVVQARRLKLMGVRKGVLDYLIVLPGRQGHARKVWVELKRQRGGVASEEQKRWIAILRASGDIAEVCAGAQKAKAFVLNLLD